MGEARPPRSALRRIVGDDTPIRSGDALGEMADQLSDLASRLREYSRAERWQFPTGWSRVGGGTEEGNPDPGLETAPSRMALSAVARDIYALRRERDALFGNGELFGEPAWDILLDLYVAYAERKQVSVSSACIGSASPPTTGLRWLGILADSGFVTREHDPQDQRRVLVRLSQTGVEAMDNYLAATLRRMGNQSAPKQPRPA